jgi:hypothetical protein
VEIQGLRKNKIKINYYNLKNVLSHKLVSNKAIKGTGFLRYWLNFLARLARKLEQRLNSWTKFRKGG